MRKERMIMRTIKTAEVEVVCIDTTTGEVQIITYPMPAQENEKRYLDYLRRIYETSSFKLVEVQGINIHQELYGMREEDFKQHAIIIK